MAVAKMNLVSITGPLKQFDDISGCLINDNFHPENAMTFIKNAGSGFLSFTDDNIYEAQLQKISDLAAKSNIELDFMDYKNLNLETVEIDEYLNTLIRDFDDIMTAREALAATVAEDEEILKQLVPFLKVKTKLDDLFKFKYARLRLGKMPYESYYKFEQFSADDLDVLFIPTVIQKDFTYGIYFVPESQKEKADAIFATLHFERIHIPDRVSGTPKQAYDSLEFEISESKAKLAEYDKKIEKFKTDEHDKFLAAYSKIKTKYELFNLRKYAAHTAESFYIAGWVEEKNVQAFEEQFKDFEAVSVMVEKPSELDDKEIRVPTKLKNPKIIRPFEEFVKMYGMPAYNEIDPTPLVAISYALLFGIMFGDVGHGAAMFVVGLIMHKFMHMFLGKILCFCSFFSVAFGFVYGSVFGNEELIPGLFHPLENSNTLNMTLMSAIVLGVVLILISMAVNIANGIKQKNIEKTFFSQNGVAGVVLYFGILITAVGLFGINIPFVTPALIGVAVGTAVVAVFLREPISKLLAKRKDWMPKNKAEFIIENFFEMFEVLLSYLTNTISFVRVGAFAVSHAGMMMVVYILANMVSGAGNIIVLIIGNIFVMALEGLISGIQVLRLQFYEIFSKFYQGDGKAFAPLGIKYRQEK